MTPTKKSTGVDILGIKMDLVDGSTKTTDLVSRRIEPTNFRLRLNYVSTAQTELHNENNSHMLS